MELRNQFNGLKDLIDAVPAGPQGPPGPDGTMGPPGPQGVAGISVPIGGVCAWLKDLPGVPALGDEFVECNGQVLSDPQSPLDGTTIPDLNNQQRFLRGGTNSGAIGGIDYFGTATADYAGTGSPFSVVSPDFSPGAVPFPPYYTVVWVMRIK